MIPRNLTLYRFPAWSVGRTLDGLGAFNQGLAECQLKPVGPLELASAGFVSPYGRGSEALSVALDAACWLTVGTEERMLPAAVVNEALAQKLEAIERQEGRRPGGRTRKRLRDELVTEMLPRAFVKPARVDAVLLLDLGLLAVDTPSRRVADLVVGEIRRALGSFPALPLNAEVAPRAVLTGWLAGEPTPQGVALGDEARLADPVDRGATVALARQELASDEVAQHLEAGKQCVRLALEVGEADTAHARFTLGEDLVLRKFKLLDGAVQALESEEREDLEAELLARFALSVGELRRVWAVLRDAFKLSEATP